MSVAARLSCGGAPAHPTPQCVLTAHASQLLCMPRNGLTEYPVHIPLTSPGGTGPALF
eukprot:gene20484-biopygen19119